MAFFAAGKEHRERAVIAANRVGKAMRDGTLVATPTGWRAIETLGVGDEVIAGDGTITSVVGVYPQGIKPLFRLTFDVGEALDCCAEHLWLYQHPRARYPYRQSHGRSEANPFYGEWIVGNTAGILASVGAAPITRMRVVMPTCAPWALPRQPVALDPYFLGLLLGDGGLTKYVRLSTADQEIIDAARDLMPEGVGIVRPGGKHDYTFAAQKLGPSTNPITAHLRAYGLFGKRSQEKFVPDAYKVNSADVRLAVLQGLMDTDGSISKTGAMEFSSTSKALADDAAFLVHSLGGKVNIERRQTHCNGKPGLPSYRVRIRLNVCPFRLRRKAERWNPRCNTANRVLHTIKECEPGHATCIEVAHPSHTFVTAHGIVTHNTETIGGYESTLHLTGEYPKWWPGRTWERPVNLLCGGDNASTTRDIIVRKLLGPPEARGTGLIPKRCIEDLRPYTGVPGHIDYAMIKRDGGGTSTLQFRSYDQGRIAWQGTERDVIWLDEEPPMEIYTEALLRLMTTQGMLMATFTPLKGMTDVALQFMPHIAPN